MPTLYTSIRRDIIAASKCLRKEEQAAYVRRAVVAAKLTPSNCVPGS